MTRGPCVDCHKKRRGVVPMNRKRTKAKPIEPALADFGCEHCGGKLEKLIAAMSPDDLLIHAANEYGRKRRELLPRTGIRPSVCSARRCLHALRMGDVQRARQYLANAQGRDPGHWDRFAVLIEKAIEAATTNG